MTKRIFLANDVYFCVTQNQGIFLDLRRDEYSSVPVPQSDCADGLMAEAPLQQTLLPFKNELLNEGLIVGGGESGGDLNDWQKLVAPVSSAIPEHDDRLFGLGGEKSRSVKVSARDCVEFFRAARRARRLLKDDHIRDTVRRVRVRKGGATGEAASVEDLTRHLLIFAKLRPWYPHPYVCLLDALMLVEFLSHRQYYPTWVFGVQAQPFGAHCWIQQGGFVLNETTEYAQQFTPIMTV